jgi:hypothetical protein
MSSQRLLGLLILIVGIVIFILGINATHAFNEKIASSIEGHYSNKTTWYILSGIVCIVIGTALTFSKKKS